ncbi:MAG: TnpV protein [Eubacteriales bacterium]|nr:TnpV protein [Eubacteriales bacterium]
MKKTIIENGIEYTLVGDYYLPNLTLPAEEERPIGIYGQRHLRYLKQYHPVTDINLRASGKLNAYLADINDQAITMRDQIIAAMAKQNGTDESLKARDQLRWVGLMNNYRACAEEIIWKVIVYS